MKTAINFFTFVFIFPALLLAQETPEFLKGFAKQSYREVISEGRSIGKTEFEWSNLPGSDLRFVEKSTMKVTLFKKTQDIATEIDVRTDSKLQIQSFSYLMKSSDSQMAIEGNRRGQKMFLKKIQAGKEQIKEILIQEPLLLLPLVRPYLLREGLKQAKAGFQKSALLFEPAASTSIPVSLEVSPQASGFILKTTYLSQTLESKLDKSGNLIEEKTDFAGIPIVERQVKKEEFNKTKISGTSSDLVERVKVSFPKIENPRGRAELRVKVSGIQLHNFQLNRHRQKLDNDILTITKEKKIESAPVQSLAGKKEFAAYLAGDVSIPVFDPGIQRKAREIVGSESDLWKRAKAIHDFVYQHLEKDPYVSLPDALEALQSGRGDCNEHAVLFTALARAAGIPTRTVVGLVFSDSFYNAGQPGFYYHAWAEVYTGKLWVSLDPTWNQAPADVTHIAFVEGGADQQIQIAAIMGKIKLSPVDAKAVR